MSLGILKYNYLNLNLKCLLILLYLCTSASRYTYSENDYVLADQIAGVVGGNCHGDEQPFILGPHHVTRPFCGL